MFKPRSPPVAGGAFFSWGSDRAAAEPKSGAARAPADRRLNSRLEKPRRPGSLFIPNPFPNEAMRAPGVGTNHVEWCRTTDYADGPSGITRGLSGITRVFWNNPGFVRNNPVHTRTTVRPRAAPTAQSRLPRLARPAILGGWTRSAPT